MREPAVMLTHSPRGWAQELHLYLMDHGGAVVRGYALGREDTLEGGFDALMVDDTTSFLSERLAKIRTW